MKRWLLCFLLCLIGCKEQKKENSKADTFVVGMSVDYPPCEFYQDGQPVGFDVDLSNEIAKRLHKKLIIKDIAFEGLIAALQSKQVDAVLSGFTPTPDRAQKVDFSRVYYKGSTTLVVHQTSPIASIKELNRVGVQAGTIHETSVMEWKKTHPKIEVHTLQKIPDLIQEMKTGRISSLLMGFEEAKTLVAKQNQFKMVSLNQNDDDRVAAFPKGSSLKKEVDSVLENLEKDGTLERLKKKWFK